MRARVVTLMYGSAYERYGKEFLRTFDEFWSGVELLVVADRDYGFGKHLYVPLKSVDGYSQFMDRWGADPVARGMRPPNNAKRDANGYSWRHDACKWMPQALAPIAALEGMQDGDLVTWLDADVRTTAPASAVWLGDLIVDADVACLQRDGSHSEIGYFSVRLNRHTRTAITLFAELYRSGEIFNLKEWHSAFAWDAAFNSVAGLITTKSLNPGGKGHVWPNTRLAECLIHDKGKRKDKR